MRLICIIFEQIDPCDPPVLAAILPEREGFSRAIVAGQPNDEPILS
jgi:hypothetical protein